MYEVDRTVVQPPQAGTREEVNYSSTDFNKENLNNLKTMFENKKNTTDSTINSTQKVKVNKSGTINNLMDKFSKTNENSNVIAPKAHIASSSSNASLQISHSREDTSANTPESRNPDIVTSVAGEREIPNFTASISLKSAMAVFGQANKAEEYRPKNNLSKYKYQAKINTATIDHVRSPARKNDFKNQEQFKASTGITLANNNRLDSNSSQKGPAEANIQSNSTPVRNADTVDDRPKVLTTSLNSAKSVFERSNNSVSDNNNARGNTPSKTGPLWEGQENENVMKSAKNVFSGGAKPMNTAYEGKQNAELERDDGLGHIQNNSGLAKNLANDLNQPKEQEVQEVKAPIDLPTEDITEAAVEATEYPATIEDSQTEEEAPVAKPRLSADIDAEETARNEVNDQIEVPSQVEDNDEDDEKEQQQQVEQEAVVEQPIEVVEQHPEQQPEQQPTSPEGAKTEEEDGPVSTPHDDKKSYDSNDVLSDDKESDVEEDK